jgi:P27 family predicted phage terminase small subunit
MFSKLQKSDPRPTQPLSDAELVAYTRIVRSREAGSFSEHDVQLATQLAQMVVLCEDYTDRIKTSGPTVTNAHGTLVANPLLSARDSTFRSITQITKLLGLSASQKGMSGAPQAKRNVADRAARKIIEKASEDDLI